jgi:hypothetical protein
MFFSNREKIIQDLIIGNAEGQIICNAGIINLNNPVNNYFYRVISSV